MLISELPNATPQKTDKMELQRGLTSSNNTEIGQLMQLSASENLAQAYDPNAGTYEVGDFVTQNGTLYQCNTAIATPEAFDATKWTAVKVTEISSEASVIQLTQAEYTALSTAEKMNGSIYKLTDKAIFYCLDEEYHPVKELTTAQYEALTSAEQNNGTIYIQTDAETTGSDIPISTGETKTIAEEISAITSINSFEQPNSNYGKFYFYEVNGLKIGVFQDPKSLVANAYTILDFTLPEKFRPKYREVYITLFEPSAAYTIRCRIQTNGVVSIYNYGTRDNTINTSGIIPYV